MENTITQSQPTESPTNKWVWILAFAPLIGLLAESLVAGAIEKPIENFWFITIAINVAISYIDEKKLEKAGVDVSGFGNLAFLVPVYIYLRSKKMKDEPFYFITWIATFIISCSPTY